MTTPSRRRLPSPKLPVAIGVLALVVATATGVALAAALGVSSTALTTSTGAASISAVTCTLGAADADSYVSESSAGSNFGGATSLDVTSSVLGDQRSFVQFSLTSCSIPAGSLITAASLELFLYAAPLLSRTYGAHRVTAAWTEGGVTWATQPSAAATPTASAATGTSGGITLTWAVRDDVQAFVDGTTNNGWRVRDLTEGAAVGQTGRFRSAEHGTSSQRPVLEITYFP